MAVALDTLEISKRLKTAGFDDAQAEARSSGSCATRVMRTCRDS
jgi:hypothetical protein